VTLRGYTRRAKILPAPTPVQIGRERPPHALGGIGI
jgi:hypothetical protein